MVAIGKVAIRMVAIGMVAIGMVAIGAMGRVNRYCTISWLSALGRKDMVSEV